MASNVLCNQCGTELDEDASGEAEKRTPCPVCGSTSRRYSLQAQSIATLSATLGEATLTSSGKLEDTVSLLMQAVIIPGAKTDEGWLIEAVAPPWFDIITMLTNDPSLAFQVSAEKWEEIIAGAYERAGFDEVTLTPRSGDFGRDVIAVKRGSYGIGTVRIIDQVKAYKPGHLVTANDVRALLGVLEADKASKGFLTTTSDFAPRIAEDKLLKPYFPARIELIKGVDLISQLEELLKNKS